MDNMTVEKKNMFLVGTLQDYGKPYASLFLDRDTDSLYLFVRLLGLDPGSDSEYLATKVSSTEISRYMSREVGLKSIFATHGCSDVSIHKGIAYFDTAGHTRSEQDIEHEDIFDPQFCYDKLKLKVFLKRFENA